VCTCVSGSLCVVWVCGVWVCGGVWVCVCVCVCACVCVCVCCVCVWVCGCVGVWMRFVLSCVCWCRVMANSGSSPQVSKTSASGVAASPFPASRLSDTSHQSPWPRPRSVQATASLAGTLPTRTRMGSALTATVGGPLQSGLQHASNALEARPAGSGGLRARPMGQQGRRRVCLCPVRNLCNLRQDCRCPLRHLCSLHRDCRRLLRHPRSLHRVCRRPLQPLHRKCLRHHQAPPLQVLR
jgi:hypothetical protein